MLATVFDDLLRINREMNRVLYNQGSKKTNFWPEFNVYEKENEYYLVGKVPGVSKKDITVTVKDNSLKITGSRKSEKDKSVNYHLSEITYGEFERSFMLDEKIDTEKIEAEVKNGLILVKLPKIPEKEAIKISIK